MVLTREMVFIGFVIALFGAFLIRNIKKHMGPYDCNDYCRLETLYDILGDTKFEFVFWIIWGAVNGILASLLALPPTAIISAIAYFIFM